MVRAWAAYERVYLEDKEIVGLKEMEGVSDSDFGYGH